MDRERVGIAQRVKESLTDFKRTLLYGTCSVAEEIRIRNIARGEVSQNDIDNYEYRVCLGLTDHSGVLEQIPLVNLLVAQGRMRHFESLTPEGVRQEVINDALYRARLYKLPVAHLTNPRG